jgi:hypothetical protein
VTIVSSWFFQSRCCLCEIRCLAEELDMTRREVTRACGVCGPVKNEAAPVDGRELCGHGPLQHGNELVLAEA